MPSERRFSDAEVARIFERAASGHPPQANRAAEGMTLAQLESIGEEVGIPAEQIARAALSLSATEAEPAERFLGMTTGVGHTVHLGRRLTDEEWERFIAGLLGGGLVMTAVAVIGEATAVLTNAAHDVGLLASFWVLGAIGIGAAATTALRLPRWARARKAQMEVLGTRVSAMALKPPAAD